MTENQKILLNKKVNYILKMGSSVGVVINNEVKQNIISYYEDMAYKNGFEFAINRIDTLRTLMTKSNIYTILLGMINRVKKQEEIAQKQLLL